MPAARLRPCALLLSLLACLISATALARHHRAAASGDATPGRFDYYLLSLSWSPTYCLMHQDDRQQCGTRGLGFVLHGLWPQYDDGGYPEYCDADRTLPPQAAAIAQTLYPSARLVQHEWESHGSCSGLGAEDYFRVADRALAAVQVPAAFEAPPESLRLRAEEIAAAFRTANPAAPADAFALACSRDQLQEVRVCLTRELALRACGRGVRSSCPDVPLLIRSSR